MKNQIRKLGLANGIKPRNKTYSLSDLIQESYTISYKAKKINNPKLIKLTESHLSNIKDDPTKTKELSEDLDVLKGLVKLGKDQKLKDVVEVDSVKRRRRKSSLKPAEAVKESSKYSKLSKSKGFKSFRESSKSKVFYKELGKFNKHIDNKQPITMTEAVQLYKACNSCLTHLTVELEKKPSFRKAYCECTKILTQDTAKLLESIQSNKLPDKSLLGKFIKFTNLMLECNTSDKLDDEIYEDADLEELDDRDVINEDADMEELDGKDVLDEDADMEELYGRDVLDEDSDLEELDDRDVINEDEDVVEDPDNVEDLEEDEDFTVDLTAEEIDILRKVLNKISSMNEEDDVDLVPDEEPVPEPDGEEEDLEEDEDFDDIEDEELEEEEDLEDEELEEDEDLEDEELEEEDDWDVDPEEELEEDEDFDDEEVEDIEENEEESIEDPEDLVDTLRDENDDDVELPEGNLDDEPDEIEDEDEINEEDTLDDEEVEDMKLSESAKNRIKKCF